MMKKLQLQFKKDDNCCDEGNANDDYNSADGDDDDHCLDDNDDGCEDDSDDFDNNDDHDDDDDDADEIEGDNDDGRDDHGDETTLATGRSCNDGSYECTHVYPHPACATACMDDNQHQPQPGQARTSQLRQQVLCTHGWNCTCFGITS